MVHAFPSPLAISSRSAPEGTASLPYEGGTSLKSDRSVFMSCMIDMKEVMSMAKNLRMKAARARLGLSQAALAELVGVTRQTINAVESGDYNPTIALCIAICRSLDVTLDDLFWEEQS